MDENFELKDEIKIDFSNQQPFDSFDPFDPFRSCPPLPLLTGENYYQEGENYFLDYGIFTIGVFAVGVTKMTWYETNFTIHSNGSFLCVCMLCVLITGYFGALQKNCEPALFLLHMSAALFVIIIIVATIGLNTYELLYSSAIIRHFQFQPIKTQKLR